MQHIKNEVMRWQREIDNNPAVVALAIIATIAVLFVGILIIDAIRKKKRDEKRVKGL